MLPSGHSSEFVLLKEAEEFAWSNNKLKKQTTWKRADGYIFILRDSPSFYEISQWI